ncbi:MAG: HYR domain-containing protein [Saprospiraceae bacterium]|nr:HYR domain-containing protein [Saprospiraceae bacterium]
MNSDPGLCSAVMTYTVPIGTNNCPGSMTTQTTGLASGTSFLVGTTTNIFVVTDAAGNTATCSFDITLADNEAPMAICQAVTVQLDVAGAATVTAAQVDNGSSDNCGIASLAVSPSKCAST